MSIDDKLDTINRLHENIQRRAANTRWDAEFLEQVKIDFTYQSNKLEGNTITLGQTAQLIHDFITPKNVSSSDILDIVNHKNVLDILFHSFQTLEISEETIKALHKELMKNWEQWADSTYYDPGKYKILDNMTQRATGKIHYYTLPANVHDEMARLMTVINEKIKRTDVHSEADHPLTVATFFHQEFLHRIHPFGDGNGRICRMIMNLILLKHDFPPIFIKDVDRMDYFTCFDKEDALPGSMLSFMADRLLESLQAKLEFIEHQR